MKYRWYPPNGAAEESQVLEGETIEDIKAQQRKLDQQWMANAVKASATKKEVEAPTLRDRARAFAQGGTFGLQDEIQAGLGTAMDVVAGGLPLSEAADQYRHLRDQERQDQSIYATRNPTENFALQMAGGVAAPGLGAARFANPGSWGSLAKAGATAGGLAGFGTAEGTLPAQALQTLTGAAVGAGLGVAAPYAAQGVARGAQAGWDALRRGAQPVMSRMTGQVPKQAALSAATYGDIAKGTGTSMSGKLERARLMDRAKELGIELTPGERQNSGPLKGYEASLRSNPMNPLGWRLNRTRVNNSNRVNEIIAREMGVPDAANEMSAQVVARRADEVSAKFDGVMRAIGRVRIDNEARQSVNRLMRRASDPTLSSDAVVKFLGRLQNSHDYKAPISGERLMQMHKNARSLANDAYAKGNGIDGELYSEIVDILNGIVDRQVARKAGRFTKNQRVPQIWDKARQEWQIIRALRQPNAISDGKVNYRTFANGMRRSGAQYRDMKLTGKKGGRADLHDVLRMMEFFGDIADSGTATRMSSQNGEFSIGSLANAAMKGSIGMVASPVTGAYMRMGSPAMIRPDMVGRGAMAPTAGLLSGWQSLQGGIYGEDR